MTAGFTAAHGQALGEEETKPFGIGNLFAIPRLRMIHSPVEQVRAFADEKEDVVSQMETKLAASLNDAGFDEASVH